MSTYLAGCLPLSVLVRLCSFTLVVDRRDAVFSNHPFELLQVLLGSIVVFLSDDDTLEVTLIWYKQYLLLSMLDRLHIHRDVWVIWRHHMIRMAVIILAPLVVSVLADGSDGFLSGGH